MQRSQIHIMSYNLLASRLCSNQIFPYASDQVCDFKFRGPRIIEEIASSQASLICLQEIDQINEFYDEKLKNLGFNMVYGLRENKFDARLGAEVENHTIAIGYKADEWVLIDTEMVQFEYESMARVYPGLPTEMKPKQAMLCLFKHILSNETVVVGNTHFEHSPALDHVKFAQACFYLEKIAKYIRDNKTTTESLPFITGGDFNA